MTTLENMPIMLKDDALTLLCFKLIGEGLSRKVYTCTLNPSKWVVKCELSATGCFQNVVEHKIWESVRYIRWLAPYFAPVLNISDGGAFMVQERTTPARVEDLRRKLSKVPACFTDIKVDNWGWLGNRIVCHDYGVMLVTENGLSRRMVRANW